MLFQQKNPASIKRRGCYNNKSGGVLLSHAVAHVVSSALQGLTTEFGMGSGVAPALWPPETVRQVSGFRFQVSGKTRLTYAVQLSAHSPLADC
jgi:hypothetical protein